MKILLNSYLNNPNAIRRYLGKDVWVLVNIMDHNIKRPHSFYIRVLEISGNVVTYNYISFWFIKHIYLGSHFDVADYDTVSKTLSSCYTSDITLYNPIEVITDYEMQDILSYKDTYQPPTTGEIYE